MDIRNVLLINPPFSLEKRYEKGLRDIGAVLPPLGLMYLASSLEANGYEVRILDAQLLDLDERSTLQHINKSNPDLIGITCGTPNANSCIRLAKSIKNDLKIPIIFGGPHPSLFPHSIIKTGVVDYIVKGEGEVTLNELINTLNKKSPIKHVRGIAFMKRGKVILTQNREPIKDLDSLPFPARHLLPMKEYKPSPTHYKRLPMATMITSRGCPFNCFFCSSRRLWKGIYRLRSVDNVLNEIKFLIDRYKVKEIGFWDDLWGLNPKWVGEFVYKVKKERIDITWSCDSRVNVVTREGLKKMASVGCWSILFGIESMDQEILDTINKGINLTQIKRAIQWCKEASIEVRANYITGLPNETPLKLKKIVERIIKSDPDYVKFNIFTPFPGTKLYDDIIQGKWGKTQQNFCNFEDFTTHKAVFIPHGYKDLEQVKKMKKYAFRKFYFRPKFIIKKLLSIRSKQDLIRNIEGFKAIIGI